jgi:alginate O-acetyltransferase complex protein AlgI
MGCRSRLYHLAAVIFASYWFVAFALIFLPLFWLARLPRLRLVLLGVGCAIFHGHFAGPAGVIPIVILAVLTYLCGLTRRPAACVLGMLVCTAALVFYKYTRFLAESLMQVWTEAGTATLDAATPLLPALPPLGISFFVFEFVHYLFDVRRGSAPIRNPLHFGLFAVFWPSLVAGPIKRYEQFIPSLIEGVTKVQGSDAIFGISRVAVGLLKKVTADNLTLWIGHHGPAFDTLDLQTRWLFMLFLAMRIYLDFSGYSDMAIGFARMMGIRLPENFNWPYGARSIDEFWSRWHISLSSWIRDYIYIPLGGSRHGLARKILNGFLAFAICGLWHGSAWNFVLWGLYHGAGLAISGNYARVLGRPGQLLEATFARVPALSIGLTLFFVWSGWLLFFYPVPIAVKMFTQLFRAGP